MPAAPARFDAALARFDAAHAEDPARERYDGVDMPRELAYARRMSAWLGRLAPDASEALRLAARCQHLRRWEIPRDAYPRDVDGYRAWRTAESRAHAEAAARILADAGYDDATVHRVQALVRKERIKQDAEAQTLEDVACLVFLESGFVAFAAAHDDATLVRILRGTWRKMSPHGQGFALGLALPPRLRGLVERATAAP
jgi:hypothetical protein